VKRGSAAPRQRTAEAEGNARRELALTAPGRKWSGACLPPLTPPAALDHRFALPVRQRWLARRHGLRSNGFTTPGWFGDVAPNQRINFNPSTGALSTAATQAQSTTASFAGTLYAISRGNTAQVAMFITAPFAGVIAK
jgi:hypothetical protein